MASASEVASLRPKNKKQGWIRKGKKGLYTPPGGPVRGTKSF